jgi:hypothetical protein
MDRTIGNPCGVSPTAPPQCSALLRYNGSLQPPGTIVRIPAYRPTERYSTIVTCGGLELLLTRHNVRTRLPPAANISKDIKGKWTAASWETVYRIAHRTRRATTATATASSTHGAAVGKVERAVGGTHSSSNHSLRGYDYSLHGLALSADLGMSHNAAVRNADSNPRLSPIG